MTSAPDVSIIIAAYNAEDHIRVAIASALAQTGVSIEVIVADDASTDTTPDVVVALPDPRVRVVRLGENGGPSVARNAAIVQARGAWLAVLDADDAMTPDRISTLLNDAQTHGCDIIADNLQVYRGANTSLMIDETLDGGVDSIFLNDFIINNIILKKSKGYGYLKPMFRAAFLRENGILYDNRLRIGEDYLIVSQMLAKGAIYLRKRFAGYIYNVREGSISHRLSTANAMAIIEADERFMRDYGPNLTRLEKSALREHLNSARDAASFARVIDALKAKQWRDALAVGLGNPRAMRHMWLPIRARLHLG